jgi:DNA-binding transcriptional MerR regulator
MSESLTTAEAGRILGVPTWRIRRVFTDGLLPEPRRCGMNRTIRKADLRRIERILRQSGAIGNEANIPVVAK